MMGKTIIVKGQPYKMKYRPDPISRLSKPMVHVPLCGNPSEAVMAADRESYCVIVYRAWLDFKNGIVPPDDRHGLWFYALRED